MMTRSGGSFAVAFVASILALSGCGGDGSGERGIDDLRFLASEGGLLETTIVVKEAASTFGPVAAYTATYDGAIPGPVLRLRAGDTLRLHLVNMLPPSTEAALHDANATNVHFHGLHVPPTGMADNVYLDVPPGGTFDYELQIPADHTGGFFWYHPHLHGNVTHQVGGGMTGAIVIEGPLDQVPEVAAARERFLILNELKLDANGRAPPVQHGVPTTSTVLVSGHLVPPIDVRPGEVQRWRILAANGDRFFLLTLDGHDLHQIAKDGFPFAAPVVRNQILLLPGERTEVLVQGGTPGIYALRALAYDRGGMNPPVPEIVLGEMVVVGDPVAGQLPATLVAPPPPPQGPPAVQRFFGFDQIAPHPAAVFAVNGMPFAANVVSASPVLGTTEDWLIFDIMGEEHPFHLHTHPFQVIDVNGMPVANPAWQDTALVPSQGYIVIRVPFTDFPGRSVFHCHILEHEDLGMMANFEVVP
jgi:FtsP/CotA-like multicopper oxidase with cupredoxin domain